MILKTLIASLLTTSVSLASAWDDFDISDSPLVKLTESPFRSKDYQDSLKIMWWNISEGALLSPLSQESLKETLSQNILTLLASPQAPDMIILGNYNVRKLTKQARHALECFATPKDLKLSLDCNKNDIPPSAGEQHHLFLDDYDGYAEQLEDKRGLRVFSRFSFETQYDPSQPLDWTRFDFSQDLREKQRAEISDEHSEFDLLYRPFITLNLQHKGEVVKIFPFDFIKADDLPEIVNTFRLDKEGAEEAHRISYANTQPYFHRQQVKHFRWALDQQEDDLEDSSMLFIGSFNMNSQTDLFDGSLRAMTTSNYQKPEKNFMDISHLARNFGNKKVLFSLLTEGRDYPYGNISYPSSNEYEQRDSDAPTRYIPRGNFDRAFANKRAQAHVHEAQVWPLEGASHYPVYLIFN